MYVSLDAGFTSDQAVWEFRWKLAMVAIVLLCCSERLNPMFYNLLSRYKCNKYPILLLHVLECNATFTQRRAAQVTKVAPQAQPLAQAQA